MLSYIFKIFIIKLVKKAGAERSLKCLKKKELKHIAGLRFSKENQRLGLKAGINGMLIGNYLTTNGVDKNEDIEMLESKSLKMV